MNNKSIQHQQLLRDRCGMPSPRPPSPQLSDQMLVDLAKAYEHLRNALQCAKVVHECIDAGQPWDEDKEAAYQTYISPLLDRLHEIAWQAAEIKAQTVDGLIAKASVLCDWCDGDRKQITDALAQSLCQDVISVLHRPSEP